MQAFNCRQRECFSFHFGKLAVGLTQLSTGAGSKFERGGLLCQADQETFERGDEGIESVFFELFRHIVKVDPGSAKCFQEIPGCSRVGIDRPRNRAMILKGFKGCIGDRIDRLRSNEGINVERVWVLGILCGGRSP